MEELASRRLRALQRARQRDKQRVLASFWQEMVDHPGATWEQAMAVRERELACYPAFESLAREIVPWCRERYHVSGDAARTVVAGGSAGGLAAAFATLRHPQTFGNVLSMSGSFWWKPDDEEEQ